MRIAILVWGSLYWNPGDLSKNGEWFYDGPALPIEFARISSNNRLTLVIKPGFTISQTIYVVSGFETLQEARENLRIRENTENIDNIGFIDFTNNTQNLRANHAFVSEILRDWNSEKNFDAIIWSDFAPNFYNSINKNFTVSNVITFLDNLKNVEFSLAKEYILNAPEQIRTEYRKQLEEFVKSKV